MNIKSNILVFRDIQEYMGKLYGSMREKKREMESRREKWREVERSGEKIKNFRNIIKNFRNIIMNI